ncbi:undecaprenyl-diphosphatase [Nocardia tenerifensis]|uniref:Undecaprenyl-diphosphatase n=1 Tax=Nocardia tenerifensis TaxID=228006 RepID=A0A318K799_9NOCA|nr:phosphatase PAP2 family protein [Nocardia tenerifensis]PXX65336.1 undecaprenyl-diphosphatase [Nocardia tenerifensis]
MTSNSAPGRWWNRVPLLALPAAVLAVFVVVLTVGVLGGTGLTAIDSPVSNWAIAHRNGTLTPLAILVSNLGGTVAMTIVATLSVIVFAWRGYRREAVLVTVVGLGSWVLVDGGKNLIGRARPPIAEHIVVKTNYAYPSGHSLGSMAVIGILAVLLIPRLRRPAMRWIAAIAAAIFVAAVGLSRIYLGVHWPTDVLGGWSLGALLVLVCVAGYRLLERRRSLAGGSLSGSRAG